MPVSLAFLHHHFGEVRPLRLRHPERMLELRQARISGVTWLRNIVEKIEAMAGKINPIPDEMTINRASDFWDHHSVADYPSEIVEFEVESGERRTFVAIEKDLLESLENRARKSGVSIETLVNLWIQEKLAPAPSA